MISKLKKIKAQKGFTLIETLLAILILASAIAGPLSIAAKGLQLSRIAKDQVVATFLAQDAIEYVRFIRDTNRLGGNTDWLAGLDGADNGHTVSSGGGVANCTGGSMCIVDSLKDQATYCGTSVAVCAASPLYFDPNNNYYTYANVGTTQTIFSRTISIAPQTVNGGQNEADVTVTVRWSDMGGVTRSVVLREDMLNWQ